MHATALRVPLMIKLLGANLLALALLLSVVFAHPPVVPSTGIVILAAIGGMIVFGGLAAVALLPLRGIEAVASRVWRGDFGARVDASPVADRDMKRIGTTFNLLLDGLVTDRSRVQALATAVIDAGDRERASLARELHDSTAQQLAGLVLQLSAAARDSTDPALAERLEMIREQAKATLEEVRLLSHTVHPRVLDDLGLPAALKKLGREVGEASHLEVDVIATDARTVPPTTAAVLYRVAQAAVHNVVKHARARHVELRLTLPPGERDGTAMLEVSDDGAGFDVADAERRRPGMGLFTMRERVALAGGRFDVESSPGKGTRIIASVPLTGTLTNAKKGAQDE
ncbi:MAG TPA: sensor histidine kinase [Gemmatimonadaceae bacterium]|nr:sensor histidine kinase [Gemmatimonadaceae bacterium]